MTSQTSGDGCDGAVAPSKIANWEVGGCDLEQVLRRTEFGPSSVIFIGGKQLITGVRRVISFEERDGGSPEL